MNTIETTVGWGEGLQWGFNMPLHFWLPIVMAGTGPAGSLALYWARRTVWISDDERPWCQEETKSAICQRWLDTLLRAPEDGDDLWRFPKEESTRSAWPSIRRISVVNWEMKARCPACRGECRLALKWSAKVGGLVSVHMENTAFNILEMLDSEVNSPEKSTVWSETQRVHQTYSRVRPWKSRQKAIQLRSPILLKLGINVGFGE